MEINDVPLDLINQSNKFRILFYDHNWVKMQLVVYIYNLSNIRQVLEGYEDQWEELIAVEALTPGY